MRFSEARQSAQAIETTLAQLSARVAELTSLIDERSQGIVTYQSRITDLQRAVAEAEAKVAPLEEQAATQAKIDTLRGMISHNPMSYSEKDEMVRAQMKDQARREEADKNAKKNPREKWDI